MDKKTIHSSRVNRIKTLFKAPDWNLQLFSGWQFKFITASTLVALVAVVASVINIEEVSSKKLNPISFGTEQTLNIFPAEVVTTDWAGVESVLIQDLDEDALYQEFTAKNSAYIPLAIQQPPTPTTQINEIENNSVPEVASGTVDNLDFESSSDEEVIVDTNVDVVPEESAEDVPLEQTDSAEETSFLNETSDFVWGVFARSFGLYPLAQLSVTTSSETGTNDEAELSDAVSENIDSEANVEEVILTPNESEMLIESVVATSTGELDDPATTSATQTTPESQPDTATTSTATSTEVEVSETVTDRSGSEVFEITLANFETPPLEPGQFVNDIQLRMSFAGRLKSPALHTTPFVEVYFNTASASSQVGLLLLDDEISNAINGGYYLFALPDDVLIDELKDASVTLKYYGEKEKLDGMFLDAVWLEVDTKTVTKEDLLARGKPDKLQHLKAPENSTLISEQLSFRRDEAPLFNLRYNSQQNALVRGFRDLIGQDLVKVLDVKVVHNSGMMLPIDPVLTVTGNGLLTLEFSDQDVAAMRPGTYHIELVMNEGGTEVLESFDFQWGILTVNPDKTEYNVGETASISIGALTPNGNTVCRANLDLYVTTPSGKIERTLVTPSGLCDGNNVIDVPDFTATYPVTESGVYEMYLERLDDQGEVLGFTTDTFLAVADQQLAIKRKGPTRIYPPATYPMELTVESEQSFNGKLIERVPASFKIYDTDAAIVSDGHWQELTWDVSILGPGTEVVSYSFDAPDLSPFLYNLGPARLESDTRQSSSVGTTSTTSSVSAASTNISFQEHRQWQIASDAVGNMILFWADGASIPTDWTCLSCGSGTFYQRFVMGSSTYNTTGGAATHTHTAAGSVLATTNNTTETGSGTAAPASHTHTYTPTIGTASNLPSYSELRVIQYTAAAGEPTTIPAGAIGIFDVASSSLPTNWNRYATPDGRYIYGENTPGTTGGSNTHTHTITGTTGGASGAGSRTRGGTANGSSLTHTHTVSGSSGSVSNEPPYITVLLGQLSTAGAPPNGLIAMWTEEVDNGWLDISSNPGDPFSGRFIKASTTYGVTGGGSTHSHADVTGLTSSGPSATANAFTGGTSGSSNAHTHQVDVTSFSTDSHLPPYLTAVFGKRQGTDPVYEQLSSRWYDNEENQTPDDPWPNGGTLNLAEREPITATSTPAKYQDELRLRINVAVSNATSTVGSGFKLQYAAASVCSAASVWNDVGNVSSSTIWRGYNNTTVTDASTLSSTTLASTTIAETYEENGFASSTPNEIPAGDVAEWDFVLQQNGAAAGTNYCFRMVEDDGSVFSTYTHYPQVYTNEAPTLVQDKLFDNEKTPSTTPWFYFTGTDAEGEKIHYQIQIDTDYGFSSPVIDRDTIDDASQFENQVLISDKAPFRNGELVEFIPSTSLSNGTTYYWRVRGQDPEGSNEWGDWSSIRSLTVDTSLTATAWFQTQDEQFDTNTLTGVQTGSDEVDLISGSTTGTMVSTAIDFTDGDQGTAWDSMTFNDTESTGDLKYQIQYLDESSTWTLIPDSDLSGNSTGFDTSPVSLLNLDVDTYTQIRIVANFTNSGGSPSLQDWTINWGYRVETPTIDKLFASEQTGTTTPTFQFTTTDPQGDSLTYQISWSTTPDFTSSTTRTSDVPSGFANIDDVLDTDPFDSGADISFTVQPADAMASGTTYWWRVRAKDTTGDDAYSFWTDARSFTVIPGTDVSTWFQTTEEQFDSNILSGTVALVTDLVTVATTATEAMIVYGEGTETEPRYRQWDGTALTSEGTLLDVGAPVKWAVVKAGNTREEYVAAVLGSDSDINVQVFNTGAWGNLQEVTQSVSNSNARGFDIAYESISGDALVAYCDGDADPSFYIWDGTSWTGTTTAINVAETTNCEWIEMASDPTSDEIIIMVRGQDGNPFEAQVWNGDTWGNSTTFGSVTETDHAGMAVEYEESGGQAVIVTSDGAPNRFRWNSWNGTTWGTAATVGLGGDFEWGALVRDVGTDEMALCLVDDTDDIAVARWSGSGWTVDDNLEVAGSKTEPGFSCVYEDTASRDNYIMLAYSDASATNYQAHNTTSWSTEAQINSIVNTPTMQLERTGDALVLGTFFDSTNDTLRFSTWDGSAWSTTADLETDASVNTAPYGQPYFIAPRNSGSEGTTVVTPGIDFDEGVGPYWDTFSWNDSQPGSSQILYHVQYQTATGSWAFIPDTDLPDNVAGTTTGPFDLSNLNTNTYNVLRPYAELTCDSGICPSISDWKVTWAGGITISGTIQDYAQSTNVNSGNVAVAVNGVLQTGKIGAISAGAWTIDNVTVFPGDSVTVFVSGANDANEAVGVARYDGQGDMDGLTLFERHLSIGSNDATTTVFTNAEIGQYDVNNDEDVFIDLSGTTLNICGTTGCSDAELYIQSGTHYSPGGKIVTHDIENNGTFTAGSYTHEINGSWDNNGTTTMTGSTLVFAATSTTESIDSTGSITSSFNNITFGTTTGSGVWTLGSSLDVDGNLSVSRGTLARSSTSITVAGNLTTGASGFWTGIGTTTFDGSTSRLWSDQNGTLQNIGYAVVDGAAKTVVLAGNVAAQTITIGANDTLDASNSNYDITVYGSWNNQNNFIPRSGEVFFAATSSGQSITTLGDAFYDLSFTGVNGAWSFTETSLLVNNDLSIATGTVNLPPTGTTTIAGSFDSTGGFFAHNNGTLYFTSNAAETITFDGGLFTNVARNLSFNGGGSWTITDANATTTNDILITQGTVTFPSGVFAIGGTLNNIAGTFVGGTGTTRFYTTAAESITTGSSAFGNLTFDGSGSWSFTDTNVDANGNLLITQGTLTMPTGVFYIGGSYDNNATVVAGTGTVTFDSDAGSETIDLGSSSLYNVIFDSIGGDWTIVTSATSTNNLTIATSSAWTLNPGVVLSVDGVFTNSVGGASTTWTGSTLALRGGDYSINTKTNSGDSYETINIASGARIAMWNSVAATYVVDVSGSLYSQDHNGVDGDLYIFGAYQNDAGTEYWSYATDFDGTDLTGGSERQVDVRFASGASASLASSSFEVLGISSASTTIASQGAGTYVVNVDAGTTTAQYYEFSDLGSTGLSLLNATYVPLLRDGSYMVAAPGGSAITLASTTIDANPGKQIFNVAFATTTAISAFNVSQTDGTPASYWWFRNGSGNLYGEAKDNDTGDPGSVRFDDSSLVITISGTVYADDGTTALVGGTCDGSTDVIDIMVDGVLSTSTSCSNIDGTFTASGIIVIGDPTLTIFLNDAPGGERGSVITRTPTTDITDLDVYVNRIIVRNEDTEALTIANLAEYDFNDDSDLQFYAATTSNPDTLSTIAGNELYVWATSTFTPGGEVTLHASSSPNGYDGTLYIDNGASFNAFGTSTLTIGGRLVLNAGAIFDAATTTVLMTATTSGKSITASSTVTFNDLTFDGVGGSWNLGADIIVNGDMTITNGTTTGTGDITLTAGNLTGNGVLSMGGGTTTLSVTNTLGGTSPWTFYNLQLGNGIVAGTTTPLFTSTTTVSGRLTIASAHFLDAGTTEWDLAGTGTVFVEDGTFVEDTSTIRYSGNGANVLSTQYYNLDLNAGAGSPTYTLIGLGAIIDGDLTIGGDATSVFDGNTGDGDLDINGDVRIRSNGTWSASDTGVYTIAGSYDNNGTFTSNNGTLIFDGSGTTDIAAGNSTLASVRIDGTANVTVSEHATATGLFIISNANAFTLTSGESLSISGQFFNAEGGAATTWTNTTLRLFGGADYSINAPTTTDTYATLDIDGTTQIRMWNSSAATYDVTATASLYSQDHANTDGDLYIWGSYQKNAADDYWSYATDFDGADLSGGSERKVDVYLATSSQVTITGGELSVRGVAAASTTIQAQGSGTYGLLIGGTASTALRYYEIRDIDSTGLEITGTADVNSLSFGDLEVSQNGGTAMTVGGTVITANPAQNYTQNRFALNGVGSGFNVTATGTSVSAWRFTNHYGDIDGESFDVDPDGDPGYVSWDDSAANITISGVIYIDEGVTPAGPAICNGIINAVRLVVAGIGPAVETTCSGGGVYSFTGVTYSPGDSLVVYLAPITGEDGATVSVDPVSNIGNFDIYWNRVIVRHESTDPITIADMAAWDSSDDGNIPFTAVDASPDTLTLPADRKLIVWDSKEFEPGGNVTLTNGGSETYGGSLHLSNNAQWTGQGTENITVGGHLTASSGAAFTFSNGTTTFTTSGSNRIIDVNEDSFGNIAFTGSGDWTVTNTNLTVDGYYLQTAGDVTLPTGTTTVSGSFVSGGGVFDANGGSLILDGTGTHLITAGGSDIAELEVQAGSYSFTDTNATATDQVVISGGTLALPSGTLVVGGDFENTGGVVTHNTSELVFTNGTAAELRASSSDLYAVTFNGGGAYTLLDEDLALLDSLQLNSGSLAIGSGTLSIGGSFDATGGTFAYSNCLNSTSTILFNSSDGGEIIDPGTSDFCSVQIGAPTGGYTLTGDATTTKNFVLASANSFTAQSGTTLRVEGTFLNSVGGANTTWSGSTLVLDSSSGYSMNTKLAGGDQYDTLIIGANSDIRSWNSAATTTVVDASSSLYSQDHAANNGDLYIYGDFHIATTSEYWSYATDFDGTSLAGSERAVTVAHATSATTTVEGASLSIVGVSGNNTTITNQGSGTYAMNVSGGTFLAQYYAFRNLNVTGLNLSGTPTISSLSYGDYELAVNGGTLISLSSTTLNANASLVIPGNRFATTTAISGNNVTLTGTTPNVWSYTSHTGNLDGEDYDVDGVSACGSVRWSDSSCLLTEQTHYRWRNDDGGLGVPDTEWFNATWDARRRVRLVHEDATSTVNAVVQLFVPYDTDMQADFDDLRFTDDTGVTEIDYWIGSTTNSVLAEVWVEVPLLAAEDTTSIYMYYNNPSAISSASSAATFIAADDFEDGSLSEYSGDTGDFTIDGTYAYGSTNGLDATSNESGRTENGGMYRLDQTISQNQTIRYKQHLTISAGVTDETCTKFAVQSTGAPASNYAVCVDLNGADQIVLVRDARYDAAASPAVSLDSASISTVTGWHTFEIDWADDDSISVTMTNESGSTIGTLSATDSNYSTGGYGFSFWFQNGGWDAFTVRPTLTTEPTVLFGDEQTDGGASWAAAQDSAAIYNVADIARLRLVVENTGVPITNQQFLLEYAPQDTAPSCESVDPSDYQAVPVQSSCGTSPVCMQGSTNVTNGASTFDLLDVADNTFTAGEARENPSNTTGNINVDQNEYTELEYVVTPTVNVVDQNLCFRVTDSGADYDTYLSVARMTLRFDPILDTITFNDGLDISLLPGTTTRVYATGTVTDLNGYTDIVNASSTFYRSGVAGGASCTEDNNNCYISSLGSSTCAFTNCSGNSCTVECYADIFFHAEPTDAGSIYAGQQWFAFVEVEDSSVGYDFNTSMGQELDTLRAIDTNDSISYKSIEVNDDTGADNASTTIFNEGNVEVNVEITGTDLTDGVSSVIPADQQKFATTTFTYASCGATCALLSSTTAFELDVDLSKPTTDSPPVEDSIYWGVAVPFGVNSAPHQGVNVFTPVSP